MKPKYRAWNKNEKSMWHVRTLLIDQQIAWLVEFGEEGENEHAYPCSFENCYLMQSTGLKDKNGAEIYEGDIVENTTQTVYLGHRFVVTWNKNYAVYQLMNNGFTSNIPLMQDFMSYEIIGNIYENEELLGV